ncbi:MAG: PQQ-binding-like beta-propeller repeat protein [Terriglobales bacterium]
MKRSLILSVLLASGLVLAAGAQTPAARDWPMFGGNVYSPSANPSPGGITAANVAGLTRHQITIPGTVDSSVIYIHGAMVKGARHNTIFLTTTYGKTLAVDADNGKILWDYTPRSYSSLAGSRQITNSIPAADPSLRYIYAASPDGYIEKLSIATGRPLWRTSVTDLPLREKMDSGLKVFHGHVIYATAGYVGDRPPYQGHVVILDARSGKLLHVWNSLCSNRTTLMVPSSCPASDAAIWGRPGAQIDPANGDIFVAMGNAPWNGKTNWGDALVELNPDAQMIGNWAPVNTDELNNDDLDVGSTSPVWLGHGLIAQGGKAGLIHLLSIADIAGTAPHQNHGLQEIATPGSGKLLTQPAVWKHDGQTWMFVADAQSTNAWQLVNGKFQQKWSNQTNGTSPFEAGSLLYVYDPRGGLNVYDAASGKLVTKLDCGSGHWESPVVVDGKIILPEGNANRHQTTDTLDIWSVR